MSEEDLNKFNRNKKLVKVQYVLHCLSRLFMMSFLLCRPNRIFFVETNSSDFFRVLFVDARLYRVLIRCCRRNSPSATTRSWPRQR